MAKEYVVNQKPEGVPNPVNIRSIWDLAPYASKYLYKEMLATL